MYIARKEREPYKSNKGKSRGGDLDNNNKDSFNDKLKKGKEEDKNQAGDSREIDMLKDCYKLTKFSREQE